MVAPSPNVLVVASAPYARVFPAASVVVHHGGFGTWGEALRAGKPSLVAPFAFDQFDSAARLQDLGLGHWFAGEAKNIALITAPTGRDPLVVLLIDRWSRISRCVLRFAVTMSDEITALHVDGHRHTTSLRHDWQTVQEPAQGQNRPVPELEVLKSPYRFIINPVVDRILELEKAENPDPDDRGNVAGAGRAALAALFSPTTSGRK